MAEEASDKQEEATSKRTRSPNFPLINLEKALDRAKQVYERDKNHYVPIVLLHERWKYQKMTGLLLQMVAALKAYGLAEDTGSGTKRQVRISEVGRKIILKTPGAEQLLRECAMRPRIFAHLWEKYRDEGGVPADKGIIKHYLVFEHEPPFNEDSVDACIASFSETIAFAGIGDSDKAYTQGGVEVPEEDMPIRTEQKERTPQTVLEKSKGKVKTFTFPFTGGNTVTLQMPHPIESSDFKALMDLLKACEPLFVSASSEEDKSDG